MIHHQIHVDELLRRFGHQDSGRMPDSMQVFLVGMERAADELREVPLEELIRVDWVDSTERSAVTAADEGGLPAPLPEEFHRCFHGVRVRVSERQSDTSGCALAATKIGGFPTDYYGHLSLESSTDEVFLGQLDRVLPPPDVPHSLVGRADLLCNSKRPSLAFEVTAPKAFAAGRAPGPDRTAGCRSEPQRRG